MFYVLFALFLIFVWKNPDISLMLFVAMVFASSLSPLVDKLSKKMNRTASTAIVVFGLIALLALIIIPILVLCAYQIGLFAVEFPKYISNIDKVIHSYPILHKLGLVNLNLYGMFSSAANYSSDLINTVLEFASKLSSLSLYFFITVIFIFFLIADKDYIKAATLKLFPSNMKEKAEGIIDIIGQRIGGYVIAQSCAIASVGIVMTLGLWIFGIPYSFLLGLITAVLDILPVVGPAIALVICLIATYESGVWALVIVTLVFAAAQFIENNFVRPYAFGKLLNLHPMLIFVFLFIATKYFGLVGTLFAPAIAATLCVLVEELYIKNLK